MKPTLPPPVEGKTEAERFNNALRKVLSTPHRKSAHEKNEAQHRPSQGQSPRREPPK